MRAYQSTNNAGKNDVEAERARERAAKNTKHNHRSVPFFSQSKNPRKKVTVSKLTFE